MVYWHEKALLHNMSKCGLIDLDTYLLLVDVAECVEFSFRIQVRYLSED